jgi:DNA polymerase-3 subunit alpha (Gram-positive type)
MLKGAPTIEEILPKFKEFVGDSVLVAHNADFDANFVRRACEDLGIQWEMTYVDTLAISQCLMPEMGRFSLDAGIRSAHWMDNGEELKFNLDNGDLFVEFTGFTYGNNFCGRAAKADI